MSFYAGFPTLCPLGGFDQDLFGQFKVSVPLVCVFLSNTFGNHVEMDLRMCCAAFRLSGGWVNHRYSQRSRRHMRSVRRLGVLLKTRKFPTLVSRASWGGRISHSCEYSCCLCAGVAHTSSPALGQRGWRNRTELDVQSEAFIASSPGKATSDEGPMLAVALFSG